MNFKKNFPILIERECHKDIKIVNMILTIVNPDMQSIKSDLNNKFNIIEITTLKQMHSIKMPNE